MKINIGKLFLCLINKHFPPAHKYRKIFNGNTIKISYSWMPKIKSQISTLNKIILNKPVNQNTWKSNCINKNTCPLNGNYLLENIPYIATIKSDKKNYQPRNYKGISENTFKKRYANHKISFNINRYKNDKKLSVEYWNLKAGNSNLKVTWAVKNQFSAYNSQSKRCSLCLNEKLEILEDKENNLLNKKSKLRHQNKYMLRTLALKIQNPDVTQKYRYLYAASFNALVHWIKLGWRL